MLQDHASARQRICTRSLFADAALVAAMPPMHACLVTTREASARFVLLCLPSPAPQRPSCRPPIPRVSIGMHHGKCVTAGRLLPSHLVLAAAAQAREQACQGGGHLAVHHRQHRRHQLQVAAAPVAAETCGYSDTHACSLKPASSQRARGSKAANRSRNTQAAENTQQPPFHTVPVLTCAPPRRNRVRSLRGR